MKHWWRKLKMIQRNGKISHVLGLEELILLKYTYYPKQSTDLIQSLSNHPWQFFTKPEQIILKFVWNKKDPNYQSNPEKKEQNWRYHTPWFQIILQRYSNQNSLVLAQKQIYKSIEQNKKPRNKSMHLWSINLWQRGQEYTMEKW